MEGRKFKLALGVVALASVLVGAAIGALLFSDQFTNSGRIETIGQISLWEDSAATVPFPDTLDWGVFSSSGETKRIDVWVRNDGNVELFIGWSQIGLTYYTSLVKYVISSPTVELAWMYKQNITVVDPWNAFVDGGSLISLAEGATLQVSMVMAANSGVEGGFEANWTIVFEAYDTSTG